MGGAASCSSGSDSRPANFPAATQPTSTTSTDAGARRPVPEGPPAPAVVEVRYRLDRRADAPGWEAAVRATLGDPRGWTRAGFRFVEAPGAPYAIVLAEADEAQALCLPYDVYRTYSCQNGPVVVLHADRWRTATPKWTGDLPTYRQMLVNHEVGHLLGMHHPPVQCPRRGRRAPLMAQQSTELNGCLPNPWPLDDEVAAAARHDQPLAPPFSR